MDASWIGPLGLGLILELATFGALFQRLQNTSVTLPWEDRYQVLVDVATGVQALHENFPPIIHSDLKSHNVLLFDAGDGQTVAKLADFGLADTAHNTASMITKTGLGTMNWSAPEVFDDHYKQKTASDVWSFGMIVYEVASRKIPYSGLSQQQLFKVLNMNTKLPNFDLLESGTPDNIKELIELVGRVEPSDRPTAAEVLKVVLSAQKTYHEGRGEPLPSSVRSQRHQAKLVELSDELRGLAREARVRAVR